MRRPTYSAALMSNTKWREVLSLIGRLGVEFEVAYIWEERFQLALPPSEEQLKEYYIADPGIAGGPAEYREIYSIRIPKVVLSLKTQTGEKLQSTEKSDLFITEAAQLGLLPLDVKDDYIYVYGYGH
jgi:hypothetical protein